MLYEEQNTFRRTPGLVTWLFWIVLTAFGGILGTFLLSFVSEANTSLNGLLIWFYLASPLFFVALGQWLLLRRFVGLMQGILVIRRLGAVPGQLLWWVIGSAIAWGVGYPFGEQFLTSIFWHESTSFPQTAVWLVTGTTWGIIGAITSLVLIWVGRARVKVR
jgi:hypothetical protein